MAKRQIIEVAGARRHDNPIPSAVRIGNMIFTSVVGGYDPGTTDLPDDPARQIANAFVNLKALIEAGGATVDDIGMLDVLLADMDHRKLVNEQWAAMFPDPENRPARHSQPVTFPNKKTLIHLKAVAVL